MEKTFTVKELAQHLNLTDRTIRNYLASGQLKGTRVGGQWRFSKQDIKDLYLTSEYSKKVKDKGNSLAKDFIDHKYDMKGDVTVCSVINYKSPNQQALDRLEVDAYKVAEKYKGNVNFTAVSQDGVGRATIIGNLECVSNVLEVFKKVEEIK